MSSWKSQRGDVPIGCLIGFLLLVVIAVFSMNMIPAQLAVGDLEKRVTELADRANRRDYQGDRIKREILEKAEDLNLDVTADNVVIDRNNKWIKIRVTFDQEIRFPGYVWIRHHDLRFERPII